MYLLAIYYHQLISNFLGKYMVFLGKDVVFSSSAWAGMLIAWASNFWQESLLPDLLYGIDSSTFRNFPGDYF